MFTFLSDIYCTLIGWLITPESCSPNEFGKRTTDEDIRKSRLSVNYGGSKNTRKYKHKNQRKNKTRTKK